MAVWKLAEMTWEEVRDLDKGKTIAVLPTGAIEAHGPHLPLGTDLVISEAMAQSGADRLDARGYEVVILPSLQYTAADFAAGFPGTISLRPDTVSTVIADVAKSLARHGISTLAVANAHLDPAHIEAIDAAAEKIRTERLCRIVFPSIVTKPWASRLTAEFKSGACHAGQYESSIVMAARPDLVRDELREQLPPNPHSLSTAIKEGKTAFEEAGGPSAYFGYPADATSAEGVRTIDVLGGILEQAVLAELDPAQVPES